MTRTQISLPLNTPIQVQVEECGVLRTYKGTLEEIKDGRLAKVRIDTWLGLYFRHEWFDLTNTSEVMWTSYYGTGNYAIYFCCPGAHKKTVLRRAREGNSRGWIKRYMKLLEENPLGELEVYKICEYTHEDILVYKLSVNDVRGAKMSILRQKAKEVHSKIKAGTYVRC